MASVRRPAAKKAARKTAKKATKKTARKVAAKKAAPRKAVRKTTARKAAVKKTAAKKATAKKAAAKKPITPKKALANTRRLLRRKQEAAHQVPHWQALDGHHGHVPQSGFQSDAARVQAAQLHEAEVRMEGNQGSISTHDRHNQGKRDQRT